MFIIFKRNLLKINRMPYYMKWGQADARFNHVIGWNGLVSEIRLPSARSHWPGCATVALPTVSSALVTPCCTAFRRPGRQELSLKEDLWKLYWFLQANETEAGVDIELHLQSYVDARAQAQRGWIMAGLPRPHACALYMRSMHSLELGVILTRESIHPCECQLTARVNVNSI